MRYQLIGFCCAFLFSAAASADLIPDGFRSVKLSIQVDAEVPKGRVLVLANTFRGASVLPVGKVEKVSWHPMAGEMRVVSLAESDAQELTKAAGPRIEPEKLKQILAKGKDCSDPFPGVRTVPKTNPAHEVRWRFRISFKGNACQADEFATQYLSKEGKVVGSGSDNTEKPTKPISPPPAAESKTPAKTQPAPPPPAPAQPKKSGCGSCHVGAPAPAPLSGLAMIGLVGFALGRRKRS